MAEDSDLEKTEPASGRRLEQAREEGQVPRSREISAFLILLVAASAFWSMGPWMMQRTLAFFRHGLIFTGGQLNAPQFLVARLGNMAEEALITFAPLILALVCAALASPFLMGSWNFSMKSLTPDLGRMNPIKGLSRLVSWKGLVELFKALGKASLVGGVAIWVLLKNRDDIFAIFGLPLEAALAHVGQLVVYSFMMIVLSMLIIVAIDVPFQLWQHYDKLKMTKQEVRQEGKEMEGSPEVKGRIRQLQREAARRRMMTAIPSADVIVTNPTHFAVALAYKSGMAAPKVLAKGMGEIALKIRQIGTENGVPMLEAPPLARALYRHAELDQEIPAGLYAAVAEVLAYVYQLASWRQGEASYPDTPKNLPVPHELAAEGLHG